MGGRAGAREERVKPPERRAGQEAEPAQEQATAAGVCCLEACRLVTSRRRGICVWAAEVAGRVPELLNVHFLCIC